MFLTAFPPPHRTGPLTKVVEQCLIADHAQVGFFYSENYIKVAKPNHQILLPFTVSKTIVDRGLNELLEDENRSADLARYGFSLNSPLAFLQGHPYIHIPTLTQAKKTSRLYQQLCLVQEQSKLVAAFLVHTKAKVFLLHFLVSQTGNAANCLRRGVKMEQGSLIVNDDSSDIVANLVAFKSKVDAAVKIVGFSFFAFCFHEST